MATQAAGIQSQPLFWEIILDRGMNQHCIYLEKGYVGYVTYTHAAPFSINTQKYVALCYEKRASESFKEILF